MASPGKRVCVIGGVAGGASSAARLRRLCEKCEINIFDRGPYVSFANCGLPYRVGNVIQEDEKLLLVSPKIFKDRFNINVFVNHTVLSIDRATKTLSVQDGLSGSTKSEKYDKLILAPGTKAIKPPVEGIDLPGIFTVKTVPDVQHIRQWLETHNSTKKAVVIGGGFIGLEMAENLAALGLKVSIIEKAPQLMTAVDEELAFPLRKRIESQGVEVVLGDGLSGFRSDGAAIVTRSESGKEFPADIVILSIGVRPETTLAVAAGLELGKSGGIKVNDQMQTSDPDIYAVGDAVETVNQISGDHVLLPLAGPASKQARIAAEALVGRTSTYNGVLGSAVVGCFGLTIACTGLNSRALRAAKIDFASVSIHPGHHVSYYPGAKPVHLKLLFDPKSGKIFGAQAIGEAGVEKRIDVIATAIQLGGTVLDLGESELCYAPQFGASKDPVNLLGQVAGNVVRGDTSLIDWQTVLGPERNPDIFLLDVRTRGEYETIAVPNSVNIPLEELRGRLGELPKDKTIACICHVGQRAYNALCALRNLGYKTGLLSGGMVTFQSVSHAQATDLWDRLGPAPKKKV